MRGRRNVFIVGLALFTLASAAAGRPPSRPGWSSARLVQGVAGGSDRPAGHRPDPAAVPGRGAGPGVRPAGRDHRHLHRGRPAARRPADPVRRRARRVALGLLRQRADRPRRHAPGVPLHPRAAEPGERQRESIDPVGVLLLGAGVVLLLLPLVQEQQWQGQGKWLLLPAGLVVLAGFVGWERRYGRRQRAAGRPVPVRQALVRPRRPARAALLRRLHRDLLHPHPVPAERPALHRAAGGPGDHAVRAGIGRRPPPWAAGSSPVRPPAGRRSGWCWSRSGWPSPCSPCSWSPASTRPGRPRCRCWSPVWAAAWSISPEPDADPVRGAGRRGRQRRRRAADGAADRLRRSASRRSARLMASMRRRSSKRCWSTSCSCWPPWPPGSPTCSSSAAPTGGPDKPPAGRPRTGNYRTNR